MLRGIELAKSCRRYWPGLSEMPASAETLQQHRVNRTNNKQSTQFSRCQTAGVQGVENEGFQQGPCKDQGNWVLKEGTCYKDVKLAAATTHF